MRRLPDFLRQLIDICAKRVHSDSSVKEVVKRWSIKCPKNQEVSFVNRRSSSSFPLPLNHIGTNQCCDTLHNPLTVIFEGGCTVSSHHLCRLGFSSARRVPASTRLLALLELSSISCRSYRRVPVPRQSLDEAGSKAIIKAADDLQASLYKPQPKSSASLSLDDIIRLLRQRFSQGKLIDSDVLRKLASVWTRKGMGRKGLAWILDLLDVLGPEQVSERLLKEHKRQDLIGLWHFLETEWKLDLHGADVEGGQVLLLAWFCEVRRRFNYGKEPMVVRIVTGWGKHSRVQGVSELSTAVKLVLTLTNSPFKQSIGNLGRFEAKAREVRVWLRHRNKIEEEDGKT